MTISRQCAFIISDSESNVNSINTEKELVLEDIILAFDGEGVLDISDIFSARDQGLTGSNRRSPHSRFSNYRNYHLGANDYSLIETERITDTDWKEYWDFPYVWSSARGNTEFSDYFLKLKKGVTQDAIYLQQILGL